MNTQLEHLQYSVPQRPAASTPQPFVDPIAYLTRRYRLPPATARLIAELARIGRAAA